MVGQCTSEESNSHCRVAIMICVFHSPGVKRGRDQWDTRLLMNGGLGFPMDKLLGIRRDMTTLFRFLTINVCE
ncbi:hypothetical protein L6164_003056 [Bauhinia variegata]|uniref:Uncharacterized protein n=1 Tax=Bauhinia variegata TaxID=167791 RepID=A0ACB9Q081_BAUVA|nr:hypothetical protein L6164_003056 [Bauhinia variegata]